MINGIRVVIKETKKSGVIVNMDKNEFPVLYLIRFDVTFVKDDWFFMEDFDFET